MFVPARLLVPAFLLVPGVTAAQEFQFDAGRDNVAAGELLELTLTVRTDQEAIYNLQVGFELPDGFHFDTALAPLPDTIPAGSSVGRIAKIKTPGTSWFGRGVSTREPKVIVANFSYLSGEASTRRVTTTEKHTIRYTTGIASFYVSGLAGVLVALIIKFLVKLRGGSGQDGRLRTRARLALPNEIAGFGTTLIIGIVVLVVLSKSGVPTQGWYDSFALGAALGLLGDENLLAKIMPGKT